MTARPAEARGAVSSSAAMEALGAAIALALRRGCTIYLSGPLAAGKTTFARGYVQALGHRGAVKSPTFTLVESYTLAHASVHHFDLYRLNGAAELEFIGIEDYFDSAADVLVEWPERGAGVLPRADLEVVLKVSGTQREVRLVALDPTLEKVISSIFK